MTQKGEHDSEPKRIGLSFNRDNEGPQPRGGYGDGAEAPGT